jgi:hypothetical protein
MILQKVRSQFDEFNLMDIYPAREPMKELPEWLLDKIDINKKLVSKEHLIEVF